MGTPRLPFTSAARCPRDSQTLSPGPYAAAQGRAGHTMLGQGVFLTPASLSPAPLDSVQTAREDPAHPRGCARHPQSLRVRGFQHM